jgi:hypothetical protein
LHDFGVERAAKAIDLLQQAHLIGKAGIFGRINVRVKRRIGAAGQCAHDAVMSDFDELHSVGGARERFGG